MSREGLVSLLITSMVVFDLCLLGFSGCVERKYDEDNYPMVMEAGSDVVDNQDVFEGEDTTEEEEVAEIDDTGDPMDPEDLEQFTDADEDETRGMDPDTADLVEDIQTMLDALVGDPDSISIDMGNPKWPPCSGQFATSCKHRCAYNGNCPCQCDGACTKAKDCCEDRAKFCSAPVKPDTADTVTDTAETSSDTAEPYTDTAGPSSDTQLAPGECPKNCAVWYNGCNTCQCKDGTIGGCTKMGCPTKAAPYCKIFKN